VGVTRILPGNATGRRSPAHLSVPNQAASRNRCSTAACRSGAQQACRLAGFRVAPGEGPEPPAAHPRRRRRRRWRTPLRCVAGTDMKLRGPEARVQRRQPARPPRAARKTRRFVTPAWR
jgi:hypothetical protein